MLKRGIINPDLVAGLASLRHTDQLVIADAGLPVPENVPVVDLSLTYGIPTFTEVLEAVLQAIVVERVTMAEEARGTDPERWVHEEAQLSIHFIPHDGPGGLKHVVREASLVIRTGEATPYANVILRSGVPF